MRSGSCGRITVLETVGLCEQNGRNDVTSRKEDLEKRPLWSKLYEKHIFFLLLFQCCIFALKKMATRATNKLRHCANLVIGCNYNKLSISGGQTFGRLQDTFCSLLRMSYLIETVSQTVRIKHHVRSHKC